MPVKKTTETKARLPGALKQHQNDPIFMKHGHLTPVQVSAFRETIYGYHATHRRDLAWRNTDDPYRIVISEIMLQQTQVERVKDKYGPFIERFPDFHSLAAASVKDVLDLWQGLGYNRRALSLIRLAQTVVIEYAGRLPSNADALVKLPGIGHATAGSILAFAFRKPSVFIETNIRRVFIHHFFHESRDIHDHEVMFLVEETLDRSNPREWYYALMDYGSMLKKKVINPNRRSVHYTRQSPFETSDRKIRGAILKALLTMSSLSEAAITASIGNDAARIGRILSVLVNEGFVKESEGVYSIPGAPRGTDLASG